MLAKTHEALIAQAQEATRNKYADGHVSAAHARLVEAVITNAPPAFSLLPVGDQFGDAKLYLRNLAAAFDDVVFEVMREARANSTSHISNPARSLISDALHDADVFGDLNGAAEELREHAAA